MPIVHEIALLEIAALPVHSDEIAQRTATLLNGCGQRLTNRCSKLFIADKPNSAGWCLRVDARLEKALGSVDITNADNNVSRQQHLFDCRLAPACLPIKQLRRKPLFKRFHAEPAQKQMLLDIPLIRAMPQHCSEAPRVSHTQYLAAKLHIEMIMFLRRSPGWQNTQMSRHSKMHNQRAMVEADQQVFAPAASGANGASAQALRQVRRKRPAQAAATQRDTGNDLTFKIRRNAATSDFDFW